MNRNEPFHLIEVGQHSLPLSRATGTLSAVSWQRYVPNISRPKVQSATMSQSKADKIEQVKANLPLPDQPPTASDWQSADARNVNVGSGNISSDVSTGAGSTSGLREPATKSSESTDMSGIGRQGKDGLEGPPKDAKAK